MTTFKYSVPWFENENAFSAGVSYPDWKAACRIMGSVLPAVDLPETAVTEPYSLTGGSTETAPDADWRRVYNGFKAMRPSVSGDTRKAARGTVKRVLMEKHVHTGLKAVHAVFLELKAWADKRESSFARDVVQWSTDVAVSTLYAQSYNCKMYPPNVAAKCSRLRESMAERVTAPMQVLEAAKRFKSGRHAAIFRKLTRALARETEPALVNALVRANRSKAKSVFPAGFPLAEVWAGKVLIPTLYGPALLATGDLQRLEQYAAGWVNLCTILEIERALRPASTSTMDSTEWMSTEVTRMSSGAMAVPPGEEVHVCRAYMQAYVAALSCHAGLVAARKAAVEELTAMPYAEESGALAHFGRLAPLSVGEIVNLGKIHKVLPAAAAMGVATAFARATKAASENPARAPEAGRPAMDPDLFRKCLRDEVARALRLKKSSLALKLKDPTREPAWYAAWRDRRVVPRVPGWSDSLDLRGSAVPPARSDYAPGTFKDSTLCPDEVPSSPEEIPPVESTSMVIRRFLSTNYPTQREAHDHLLAKHPRVARSDQKPENYKDPLRLFYIATLKDRMGVSWTEAAIYSVAKHHPCYMLGRPPSEQQHRARSMIAPATGGTAKRFFSFDLSNWSAGMAEKVQRESGELWAEVFDDPRIGRAYATMAGTTVYIQKHGALAGYTSRTANFEGYDGKAMTMVHLALMSAVVARTRQVTGNEDFSVELMTYIDDGAAALESPRSTVNAVFREFMTSAEEVYGVERFVLHATKCLPSDRMFTFLNEVYFAGAHEVSSTKAAMRIAAEPKEEHDSLADRVMVLSAGTQGAISSGLNAVVGSVFCYFLTALELQTWVARSEWLRAASPVSVALFILSPTAYYGLALPSPVGFDKTAKGASLSEGIAAMQSAARAFPDLQPVVVARLRKPLPKRSYEAILRNPLGHAGHSVIRTNRVAIAVRDALAGSALNPTAAAVMSPSYSFPTESFGRALLAGSSTISAAAISLAWKATPMPLAEAWVSKFETSRSIARLIGRPALRKIARAHRLDAKRAIAIAIGREY